MEGYKQLKEGIKQAMKNELRPTISASLERYSGDIARQILNVVKDIADWEWRKKAYKMIGEGATKGATAMGEHALIEKVSADAVRHARPKIDEFVNTIRMITEEATKEAIKELLVEKLKKQDDINAPS